MDECARLSVSNTETSAEPSLQAKQLQLKRARLADDLNDKISHRPGPIELVHKNILSVSCTLQHSLPGNYTRLTMVWLRLLTVRTAGQLETCPPLETPLPVSLQHVGVYKHL